jgi:conjugal transfer/entry exclusion protein
VVAAQATADAAAATQTAAAAAAAGGKKRRSLQGFQGYIPKKKVKVGLYKVEFN